MPQTAASSAGYVAFCVVPCRAKKRGRKRGPRIPADTVPPASQRHRRRLAAHVHHRAPPRAAQASTPMQAAAGSRCSCRTVPRAACRVQRLRRAPAVSTPGSPCRPRPPATGDSGTCVCACAPPAPCLPLGCCGTRSEQTSGAPGGRYRARHRRRRHRRRPALAPSGTTRSQTSAARGGAQTDPAAAPARRAARPPPTRRPPSVRTTAATAAAQPQTQLRPCGGRCAGEGWSSTAAGRLRHAACRCSAPPQGACSRRPNHRRRRRRRRRRLFAPASRSGGALSWAQGYRSALCRSPSSQSRVPRTLASHTLASPSSLSFPCVFCDRFVSERTGCGRERCVCESSAGISAQVHNSWERNLACPFFIFGFSRGGGVEGSCVESLYSGGACGVPRGGGAVWGERDKDWWWGVACADCVHPVR